MDPIHPEARKSIDGKALVLSSLYRNRPGPQMPDRQTQSHPAPAIAPPFFVHPIPADAIQGPMLKRLAHPNGRLEEICWEHPTGSEGYFSDTIERFNLFNSECLKIRWIRENLALPDLEQRLMEWAQARTKGSSEEGFVDYLKAHIERFTKDFELYFPISGLVITAPFSINDITFTSIDLGKIQKWAMSIPDEHKEAFHRKYRNMQGYGAIRLCKRGIRSKVEQDGHELAKKLVELLRAFITPPITHTMWSEIDLRGEGWVPKQIIVSRSGESRAQLSESLLGRHTPIPPLDETMRDMLNRNLGFPLVVGWMTSEDRTDLQERILSSLFLYSRASSAREVEDKLVYVLASLESLLLRGTQESIQQNLGERLAFFCADQPNERMNIAANVKEVYAIRSRFVHHGKQVQETQAIDAFLLTVYTFYLLVIGRSLEFSKKEDLLDAIDEVKFGRRTFADLFPPPLQQT